MTEPRQPVAVIMSTYAADDPYLLRRAIESLLTQDVPSSIDIRIYLGVDGPISEAISKVLQSFEPDLYKVAFFKSNRGLAYVLNDLIEMLEDEQLVFRMDSDDLSYPMRFVRQIEFMNANQTVDILGTAIVESYGANTRLVPFPLDHSAALKSMCWRTPVAHPTVCIRRRVFQSLRGYPTDSLNEDIALWFKAAHAGFRFGNLSEPLLNFTIGEGFWHRRGFAKAFGEFQCYFYGTYRMYGVTWRLAVPLARLLFRLAPKSIRQFGYGLRTSRRS